MQLPQVASLSLFLTLYSVVGAFTVTSPNTVPSLESNSTLWQRSLTRLAYASVDSDRNKISRTNESETEIGLGGAIGL